MLSRIHCNVHLEIHDSYPNQQIKGISVQQLWRFGNINRIWIMVPCVLSGTLLHACVPYHISFKIEIYSCLAHTYMTTTSGRLSMKYDIYGNLLSNLWTPTIDLKSVIARVCGWLWLWCSFSSGTVVWCCCIQSLLVWQYNRPYHKIENGFYLRSNKKLTPYRIPTYVPLVMC